MVYGMGLVFLILALLWLTISLFQRLDRRLSARSHTMPQPATSPDPPSAEGLSSETLAAIMAAIHRYRYEMQTPVATSSAAARSPWLITGRARQLRNTIPQRRSKQP